MKTKLLIALLALATVITGSTMASAEDTKMAAVEDQIAAITRPDATITNTPSIGGYWRSEKNAIRGATVVLSLKQKGDGRVSGTVETTYRFGVTRYPVEGTLEGNALRLKYVGTAYGNLVGVVDGDRFSGTGNHAKGPGFSFTLTR